MLPLASRVNTFFASQLNRLAQCVIPVTREKQCKQTPHPCQHGMQILLLSVRKCAPEAIFTPYPTTIPLMHRHLYALCMLPLTAHCQSKMILRHMANYA